MIMLLFIFSATTLEKALKSYETISNQRGSESTAHFTTTDDDEHDDSVDSDEDMPPVSEAQQEQRKDAHGTDELPAGENDVQQEEHGEEHGDNAEEIPSVSDHQQQQELDEEVDNHEPSTKEVSPASSVSNVDGQSDDQAEPAVQQPSQPRARIAVDYRDVDSPGSSSSDPSYFPPTVAGKGERKRAKTSNLQVSAARKIQQPSPIKNLVPLERDCNSEPEEAARLEEDQGEFVPESLDPQFWSDMPDSITAEQQATSALPQSSSYSDYLSLMYHGVEPFQPFVSNTAQRDQMTVKESMNSFHHGMNQFAAYVQSNFKIMRIQIENANKRNVRENHFQLFSLEFFKLAEKIIFKYLVPFPFSSWTQCELMKTIVANDYTMLLYVSAFKFQFDQLIFNNIYLRFISLYY